MFRLILILLAAALPACSDSVAKPKRAERQQAAEAALAKTPVPRSYRFDGNELKVIEIPVSDGAGFVDLQRCFVWRDQEFKTATLQCPADSAANLPAEHAEVETNQR
jgi:hypothetical protein